MASKKEKQTMMFTATLNVKMKERCEKFLNNVILSPQEPPPHELP